MSLKYIWILFEAGIVSVIIGALPVMPRVLNGTGLDAAE
jgi:hypothetical protein